MRVVGRRKMMIGRSGRYWVCEWVFGKILVGRVEGGFCVWVDWWIGWGMYIYMDCMVERRFSGICKRIEDLFTFTMLPLLRAHLVETHRHDDHAFRPSGQPGYLACD